MENLTATICLTIALLLGSAVVSEIVFNREFCIEMGHPLIAPFAP